MPPLLTSVDNFCSFNGDDTRTWALPGGALEIGELPTEGVAREVFEETGLKTMAVRLVGLYHTRIAGWEFLQFSFRNLVRGGTITPSPETPQVAYFPTNQLPSSILSISNKRIQQGVESAGIPHYLEIQHGTPFLNFSRKFIAPIIYKWFDIKRKWRGEPSYQPSKGWRVGAFVILEDAEGRVLWARRADSGAWNLPGGGREKMEAPWETAIRETLEETGLHISVAGIAGIYIKPHQEEIIFQFTGEIQGGQLTPNDESVEFGWYAPHQEPDNSLDRHLERLHLWAKHGITAMPIFHKATS